MPKKYFVVLALIGSVILSACTVDESTDAPTTAPVPPVSSPLPTVDPEDATQPAELEDWQISTSDTLEFSLSHPPSWFVSQTENLQGEFAVTSFDPEDSPDRGGIPQDEIKVAVIRITDGDPRNADEVINQDQVLNSDERLVDGYQATTYRIEGGLGGSYTTKVETEKGTYFIAVYPPDSELIDTYFQILDTVSFE